RARTAEEIDIGGADDLAAARNVRAVEFHAHYRLPERRTGGGEQRSAGTRRQRGIVRASAVLPCIERVEQEHARERQRKLVVGGDFFLIELRDLLLIDLDLFVDFCLGLRLYRLRRRGGRSGS